MENAAAKGPLKMRDILNLAGLNSLGTTIAQSICSLKRRSSTLTTLNVRKKAVAFCSNSAIKWKNSVLIYDQLACMGQKINIY